MSRILVTGGAGFVGSVCSAQLIREGHKVCVVDDLSTGHRAAVPTAATFYEADIGDKRAIRALLEREKYDWVFHFAAKALIPESISNPGFFFQQNVATGIEFLESLRGAGIRRVVFSSSAAVYGSAVSIPIQETDPTVPVNAYGETKLIFEHILRWYAEAYGWSVFAFRYFNACGATGEVGEDHRPETHIIPILLEVAAGQRLTFDVFGRDYATKDGTCLRDYVHVSDIAAAHICALRAPDLKRVTAYNIGSGTSYSVLDVVRIVEKVTGRSVPLRFAPRRIGDPAVLCANPTRLQCDLNWKPQFSDLDNIVRSAWQWKLSHPLGYRHELKKADSEQVAQLS